MKEYILNTLNEVYILCVRERQREKRERETDGERERKGGRVEDLVK